MGEASNTGSTGIQSRTYESREAWRASDVGGAGEIIRRETITSDGTIRSHVVSATDDYGYQTKRSVRRIEADGPIENGVPKWDVIHQARTRMGWRLVDEVAS